MEFAHHAGTRHVKIAGLLDTRCSLLELNTRACARQRVGNIRYIRNIIVIRNRATAHVHKLTAIIISQLITQLIIKQLSRLGLVGLSNRLKH